MRKKNGTGKILKICKKCKNKFYARHDRLGLFCSRSCSAKRPKKSFKIKKICKVCGKNFIVKRYRKKSAFYCSLICRRLMMPKGINHVNWKGGLSRSWASKVKIKRLIKLKGKCEECNTMEFLQGHHIVPISENRELMEYENNIQILCKFCHAKKHPNISNFILKGRVYE